MGRDACLVDFWEVGQGDCSVIQLPSGRLLIIDVGPLGSPVVDWVSRYPNRFIESIIITHNDSDHVGALTSLLHACPRRVGAVHWLVDRDIKDSKIADLYRYLDQACRNGEISEVSRLEAPKKLWPKPGVSLAQDIALNLSLDVIHPSMLENVGSSTPNITSGVIVLSAPSGRSVLWAGDTSIKRIAAVACGRSPSFMLGPHHGGPTDRKNAEFPRNLVSIAPGVVIASAGTNNPHKHPAVSYIKHSINAGAEFYCTQLTKHCEKPGKLHHVFKGSGHYGLPQTRTGFSCMGTIRLTYNGDDFQLDDYAVQKHRTGVEQLCRPKCLRFSRNIG